VKQKHGMCGTSTYTVWVGMRFRNKDAVCPEWENSAAAFLADMGERPQGKTLRRKDPTQPYSKENCAWLRRSEWCVGEANPNYRHGKAMPDGDGSKVSKTYMVWGEMVSRTTNPSHKFWARYGGRGITVCDKWRTFPGFFEDMGEKPKGYTLERIDNDRGYCKENCRWATYTDQARNKRNTVHATFNGEKTTLGALSAKYGISYPNLYYPYRAGKPLELLVKMNTDINRDKLDKNVPIPVQREAHADIAASMAVGDSVLFSNRAKAKGLQQALKKVGRAGCIRKTDRGYRLWRTA